MLATVNSAALIGVDAHPVQVEINTGEVGEPRIFMVGLPDAAVKESTDRVKSALMNCGYKAPETRTTINLAPGYIRKEGPMYDLPIALGLLASTGQLGLIDRIAARLKNFLIAGELGLSGEVRPVRGGLALARLARKHSIKGVILPSKSAGEAALVEGVEVIAVRSLDHAVAFLLGQTHIEPLQAKDSPFHRNSRQAERKTATTTDSGAATQPRGVTPGNDTAFANNSAAAERNGTVYESSATTNTASVACSPTSNGQSADGSGAVIAIDEATESAEAFSHLPDFAEVKGQATVRRAVEIAVAGGHNIL